MVGCHPNNGLSFFSFYPFNDDDGEGFGPWAWKIYNWIKTGKIHRREGNLGFKKKVLRLIEFGDSFQVLSDTKTLCRLRPQSMLLIEGQGAMCWEGTWIKLDSLNTISESIKESYSVAEDMIHETRM